MQLSVGKDISTILPPRRGHGPVVVAGSQIEQIFPVGDEVIVTNNN
jgi:hypothetical protein